MYKSRQCKQNDLKTSRRGSLAMIEWRLSSLWMIWLILNIAPTTHRCWICCKKYWQKLEHFLFYCYPTLLKPGHYIKLVRVLVLFIYIQITCFPQRMWQKILYDWFLSKKLWSQSAFFCLNKKLFRHPIKLTSTIVQRDFVLTLPE